MNITAKHTPGPWEWDLFSIFASNGRGIVAREQSFNRSLAERGSNARLIAAAPEGYALAQHILALESDPYLQGHPEWEAFLNEAAALIRKAEGKE